MRLACWEWEMEFIRWRAYEAQITIKILKEAVRDMRVRKRCRFEWLFSRVLEMWLGDYDRVVEGMSCCI